MKNNKFLIAFVIVLVAVVAAVVGTYAFELGAFLFKAMIGLVAIIIFALGVVIGRFFPYKSKKGLLNE